MSWVVLTATDSIEDGHAEVFEAGGHRIALCRTDGEFYAIDDVCTHDGGSLDQGQLTGKQIECPRHGARFDIVTGRALCLPAVRPVRTYPTRVNDGQVEVEIQ
jgi:3-phenylpropionate/trans-cinnamate dioxygenase ferredoxin component